ncbi:DNA-binding protein [Variovorax guangxiensis]|uniref:DNA-binding protein n=1 Tax=Variovorax guangxiensis TaxID=1775474 RepID=UPI002867187E|nr:DNA-binding protein [Variovorax guangxiensis]MDR6860547.1 chromosome segregation ATPase [Variovorax guangxiensis]
MAEIRQTVSRGIQEDDVFAAADALLAEGKRPTIERVRLKVGRGSPNTVSPMLERWFATLGERLVGSTAGSGSGRSAGNDPDGMPVGVRNAAKLLWETARREAEEVQRGELESVRAELQAREDALAGAQAALSQREEAFAQARVGLDAALASSQQARESLEHRLKEHALEAHRVRIGLDDDIKRLTALLSQASETQDRMRREHAEAMAARDQDLRQAEERHAVQERRMLAEVDRARQTAKALESDLAREQQRRVKSEEAAARRLEREVEKLHQVREAARQVEAGLREQLAAQGIELAQARTQTDALAASVEALEGRIDDEKAAHEQTRRMLAEALVSKSTGKGDASTRRRRKP